MIINTPAITRGTHPPWLTLKITERKYESSTINDKQVKSANILWNVVTRKTITTAVPISEIVN